MKIIIDTTGKILYIRRMPYRKTVFGNGEVYHIFSRGHADQQVFRDNKDYQRMVESLVFYLYANPPLRYSHFKRLSGKRKQKVFEEFDNQDTNMDVIAYCFLPTHYHLLVRQDKDTGVQNTIRKFQNSYAKYFNTKYNSKGLVFQSPFKAAHLENEYQIVQVSRYIHLKPSTTFTTAREKLDTYEWSSLSEYLKPDESSMLSPDVVLNSFANPNEYKNFVLNDEDYQRELNKIKSVILDKKS